MNRLIRSPLALRGMAALFLTCLLSLPAQADTPEQRATLAKAVAAQVMALQPQTDQLVAGMAQTMRRGMEQGVRGNARLNTQQQDRVLEVFGAEMAQFQIELINEMKPIIEQGMVRTYTERFSLAELQELQRFYATTAGAKSMTVMAQETPKMLQPIMGLMQQRTQHLQERLKAAAARLQGEGIPLGPH